MERALCPICGGPPIDAGSKLGAMRPKIFKLASCDFCGASWVVNPDDDLDEIYNYDYYIGRGADPLVNYVDELNSRDTCRQYEWQGLVRVARDLGAPTGARWLDYGGGAGGFSRYLRQAGFDAYSFDTGHGIEIAKAHGIAVASEDVLTSLEGQLDVISAIEVFEHIADPLPIFKRLVALLKPGGIVILTTGNVAAHRGPLAKWSYVIPEVHITFYAPRTLDYIYNNVGLQPIYSKRSRGWNDIIRYKVLKNLGLKTTGWFERFLPWAIIGPLLDRYRGVSAMPPARAIRI